MILNHNISGDMYWLHR